MMNHRISSSVVWIPLGLFALLGCKREPEPAPAPVAPAENVRSAEQAAGAQVELGDNARAIESLAAARCAREQRCGNIGADEKYESQQDCLSRLKADKYDELNASECRGGINQDELNECLEEVRNEDCNNPLDTLGRLTACRSSDLCKAVAP